MANRKIKYTSLLSALLAFFGWLFSRKVEPIQIKDEPNIFVINSNNSKILEKGKWCIVNSEKDAIECSKKYKFNTAILKAESLKNAEISARFQIKSLDEILFFKYPKIFTENGIRNYKKEVYFNEILDQYLYFSVKSIQKNLTEIPSFKELFERLGFVVSTAISEYLNIQ